MVKMKIFRINLVRCMGNLSRVLDFASHLEVEQRKRERGREEGERNNGRKEEGRKMLRLLRNQFCLLSHCQEKFYNIYRHGT